jgi:hypothetical protein
MAFPNVSDIVATTIENRSADIADNVTKNNALLSWIKDRGNVRPISGGSELRAPPSRFQRNCLATICY